MHGGLDCLWARSMLFHDQKVLSFSSPICNFYYFSLMGFLFFQLLASKSIFFPLNYGTGYIGFIWVYLKISELYELSLYCFFHKQLECFEVPAN